MPFAISRSVRKTVKPTLQLRLRRSRGAAIAEYMPILAIGLITAMAGYQRYGEAVTRQIGEIAQEMASNYYQGWFYPKGTPGLALPGGSGSQSGGSGPGDSEGGGSGDTSGDGGGGTPGDGQWPPVDDLFPDPGGGGPGGGMCYGPGEGGGGGSILDGITGSSSGGMSTAPTYTLAGNPIDFGTGNKFQRESDYRHHGETPLVFERFYNSRQSGTLQSLGYGWRHSYQRQIVPLTRENEGDATVYQKLIRDDGSVYLFQQAQDGWVGLGVVDQLDLTDNGWRYTTVNGVQETYNQQGQLQSIQYPNGIIHQLTYSEGRLTTVTDSRGDQLRFDYESQWLARVELPNREVLRFQYSEEGNLKGYQRLRRGIWSSIEALWQPNTASYHYEDARLSHALTGITDAEGRRYATWGYDPLGRASLSEHGDGVERLTFDYRNDGTVAMTNATGLITIFLLEAARPGYRRLVRMEGQATPSCPSASKQQHYDEQGFVRLAINAEDHATAIKRNRRGLITRQDHGLIRQQGQWLPVEGSSRIERQWHNRLPLVTEETFSRFYQGKWQRYRKSALAYSEAGRLLSRTATDLAEQAVPYATYGDQRHWSYHYTFSKEQEGQIAAVAINGPRQALADGSDDITTYHFNDRGLLTRVVNPLGHTVTIDQYNADGQPTRATLANGLKVHLAYNRQGQVTNITRQSQTGDLSETTTIDYDRNGLVTRVTLADGSWQSFDYNDARQLVAVRNNQDERIAIEPSKVSGQWTAQLVYDSKGKLVRQSERTLDSLGRVFKLLGQHGQETGITYDKTGRVIAVQEKGIHHSTKQVYDSLNRLTEVIDALQGKTRIDYGLQGLAEKVTDAEGSQTHFRYNGFGEVIWQSSDATGPSIFYRDSAGNVVASGGTLDNTSSQYTYDLLNRPLLVEYQGTVESISYTYDQEDADHGNGIGLLTQARNTSGITDYQYDDFGRQVSETLQTTVFHPDNSEQINLGSIRYQYTFTGQLEKLYYSNGAYLKYRYSDQRIVALDYYDVSGKKHNLLSNIEYDVFADPVQWRYGNGLDYQLIMDVDSRPKAISLAAKGEISQWAREFGYDINNNLVEVNKLYNSEWLQKLYGYDDLHRLIEEQFGQTDKKLDTDSLLFTQYLYDGSGNRLLKSSPTEMTEYRYADGNRLMSYGKVKVELDRAGNLRALMPEHESSPVRKYQYGHQNLPVVYLDSDRTKVAYYYNTQRQRTDKVLPDEHYRFRYHMNGQLLSETRYSTNDNDKLKTTQTHYVWLGDKPVAQIVSINHRVQVTYLHPDHLKTPRLGTDKNQTIVWRWNSDAFGLGVPSEDPDGDGSPIVVNLRFPGQYYDQENGLHYNFHRYYDPATGRYTQSDPIGLMGGLNTYSYAYENPVKYTDPFGLAVYLTYHEVKVGGGNGLPTGRFHLAVLAVPDNQLWAEREASKSGRFLIGDANAGLAANKYYTTFSAGPDFNGLPPGKLESTPNRAGDEPWNNDLYSVIISPVISENLSCSSMSDSEFITRLLKIEAGFQSTLDYDFFPVMDEDGYNSNSFAIGLLNAAGVEVVVNSPEFPGAQKPVPEEFFGTQE